MNICILELFLCFHLLYEIMHLHCMLPAQAFTIAQFMHTLRDERLFCYYEFYVESTVFRSNSIFWLVYRSCFRITFFHFLTAGWEWKLVVYLLIICNFIWCLLIASQSTSREMKALKWMTTHESDNSHSTDSWHLETDRFVARIAKKVTKTERKRIHEWDTMPFILSAYDSSRPTALHYYYDVAMAEAINLFFNYFLYRRLVIIIRLNCHSELLALSSIHCSLVRFPSPAPDVSSEK